MNSLIKKYVLEVGQLAPAKQEYSYQRRAQSVTYTMQWQQDSISNSIGALKQRFTEILNQFFERGRIYELGGPIVWDSGSYNKALDLTPRKPCSKDSEREQVS